MYSRLAPAVLSGQANRLPGGPLLLEWWPDRRHRHGTAPRAPTWPRS